MTLRGHDKLTTSATAFTTFLGNGVHEHFEAGWRTQSAGFE